MKSTETWFHEIQWYRHSTTGIYLELKAYAKTENSYSIRLRFMSDDNLLVTYERLDHFLSDTCKPYFTSLDLKTWNILIHQAYAIKAMFDDGEERGENDVL